MLQAQLCFKHSRKVAKDNTVRFQLHTLQLLPGADRPSYAGTVVEVLVALDGRLSVRREGRIIPAREAPPPSGISQKWRRVIRQRACTSSQPRSLGRKLGRDSFATGHNGR